MRPTFNLFFVCFFCFLLTLLSGCGGGIPKLTPAEQAEVDGYIREHGRDAMVHYLNDVLREVDSGFSNTDENY